MWKSSVGGSSKAGGPSYVQQFARITDGAGSGRLARAEASYATAWRDQFAAEHDPSGLAAETNVLRYVSVDRVVVTSTSGAVAVGVDALFFEVHDDPDHAPCHGTAST